MVTRARYAVCLLALFAFSTVFGCTAILGIDTDYEPNPCNSPDAGMIPAKACGNGACFKLQPAVPKCENGLPITCKPGEPCQDGLPDLCTPGEPQDQDNCNDGIDNDCDGNVDEDDCVCQNGEEKGCYNGSAETRNKGLCRDGKQACQNSAWGQCVDDVLPAPEECDSVDNDCDGEIDEDCDCVDGQQQFCYGGSSGTLNVGLCLQGKQTCKNGTWGKCNGDVVPTLEVCDGVDNNCNGTTDEGCQCQADETRPCYTGPAGTEDKLPCKPGVQVCINGKWDTKCTGDVLPKAEVCNTIDDDCNGVADDGVLKVGEVCEPVALGPCFEGKGVYICDVDKGLFCKPNVSPKPETCNNVDDDCNGTTDDGQFCCPNDNKKSGNETDVDCGGSCAKKCDDGLGCVKNEDCVQKKCVGNVCQPPQCSDGVQNGNESDVDCGGSCPTKCPINKKCLTNADCETNVCDGTTKLCAQKPLGYTCIQASECVSNFCVDGVCCNIDCVGACKACTQLKKGSGADGVCGNIALGTDPDDECGSQSPSTCGTTGYCDGAGACQLYPASTICVPASCADATTLIKSDQCNGSGFCSDNGTQDCSPFTCANGMCQTACTLDTQCASTAYCNGLVCQPRKSIGSACAAAKECLSGSCVDNVCCDTACNGACQACTAQKKGSGLDGVCAAIAVGTDPDNECATDSSSSCGKTGFCDGSGACQKYPSGTVCNASLCTSSTNLDKADLCDGNGNCVDAGSQDCSPSTCANGVCLTSCTNDSQCGPTAYCNGLNCVSRKTNGTPCGAAKECLSNSCVDSVCCNTVCNGACQACTAAKKGAGVDGICDNVISGGDPDNECTAQSQNTCGTTGVCNGSGACEKFANGTSCGAASCVDATTLKTAQTCDGNGVCSTASNVSCAPFTCAGNACLSGCTNDAQCASTGYCNGTICLTKKTNGTTCTAAKECVSNSCVDGVCCNTACGGTCEACTTAKKGSGLDGTCGPIALGSDPDTDCTVQTPDTCGFTGVCNGMGACQLYSNSTVCGPASCAADGITLNLPDKCSGSGTCNDGGTTSCAPYACAGTACLNACTSDMQCAPTAYCNGTQCVNKNPNGTACTNGGQCTSGQCIDGFCCDTACVGTCQACSAAKKGQGTNGVCGPVAAGNDFDNECTDQGAGTCGTNGSCDGAGACQKYTDGTTCAAATCMGTILSKADLCTSGMCVDSGTQDCAPYNCLNGACTSTCTTDAQCAPTAYCKQGQNQCVAKSANGTACTNGNQCATGLCVDSFCCDSACGGTCEACSAAKKGQGMNGVCGAIVAGSDPDNDCTDQGASTCGTNGSCDGAGACQKYTDGTTCTAASCNGTILNKVDQCSSGTCADGGTQDCSPFNCSNGACLMSCTLDTHCAATAYCNTAMSQCTPKKANGASCGGNSQCTSGRCTSGTCEPATCGNSTKDGDETDVDCGGSCVANCAVTKSCMVTADCDSGLKCNTTALKCEPTTCGDGTKNGTETDVDCGGTCVADCAITQICAVNADCASGLRCNATALKCEPATCGNSMQDGTETDVDCGGTCIADCGATQGCADTADCASGLKCHPMALTCEPTTCGDGMANGMETDVDCGGTCVADCAVTQGCAVNADCGSGLKCNTTALKCEPTTCGDTIQNGHETDVDCGGDECVATCADGKKCTMAVDCTSGVCEGSPQTCQVPTCFDGVKNGSETAIDCGTAVCPCTVLMLSGKNGTTLGASFRPEAATKWTVNASITGGGSGSDEISLTMNIGGSAPEGFGVLRSNTANKLNYTLWSNLAWGDVTQIGSSVTDKRPTITYGGIPRVVFRSQADSKYYYQEYAGSWSSTDELVTGSAVDSTGTSPPAITVVGNDAIIAFVNTNLRSRTRTAGSPATWGSEDAIGSIGSSNAPEIVTLSTTPTATLLAAYVDSDSKVYYSTRLVGGSWSSKTLAFSSYAGTVPSRVSLTALPGGKAAMAFRESANKLMVSFFDGSAWSMPAQVGSLTTSTVPAITHGVAGAVVELAFLDNSSKPVLYFTRCTAMASGACSTWTTATKVDNTDTLTSVAIASWP